MLRGYFHRFTFGKYICVQKKICVKSWNASWLNQLIKTSVKKQDIFWSCFKIWCLLEGKSENYHRWSVSVFLPLVNELLFPINCIFWSTNESFSTCFNLTPNTFLNLSIFRWTLLPVLETLLNYTLLQSLWKFFQYKNNWLEVLCFEGIKIVVMNKNQIVKLLKILLLHNPP